MTRIIAKICIRRKCTSQTIHEFFVKPAKRAFSCTAKAVFVSLRLVVGRRPKGRRGAWRRSFPRSDRGYRMRHPSDLLANALPRPFRRRNAARQAGSVSWSRASAICKSEFFFGYSRLARYTFQHASVYQRIASMKWNRHNQHMPWLVESSVRSR